MAEPTPSLADSVTTSIESVIVSLQQRLAQLEKEQLAVAAAVTEADASLMSQDVFDEHKAMMAKVSTYHTKLLAMRSAMTMTSTRTKQLQQKADRLKSARLSYLTQLDDIQRLERAHDQAVAAQVNVTKEQVDLSSSSIPSDVSSHVAMPPNDIPTLQSSTALPPSSSITSRPDQPIAIAKTRRKKPRPREVEIAEDHS